MKHYYLLRTILGIGGIVACGIIGDYNHPDAGDPEDSGIIN